MMRTVTANSSSPRAIGGGRREMASPSPAGALRTGSPSSPLSFDQPSTSQVATGATARPRGAGVWSKACAAASPARTVKAATRALCRHGFRLRTRTDGLSFLLESRPRTSASPKGRMARRSGYVTWLRRPHFKRIRRIACRMIERT